MNIDCEVCNALERECNTLGCKQAQLVQKTRGLFRFIWLHLKASLGLHCFHQYRYVDEHHNRCIKCNNVVYVRLRPPQHFHCRSMMPSLENEDPKATTDER